MSLGAFCRYNALSERKSLSSKGLESLDGADESYIYWNGAAKGVLVFLYEVVSCHARHKGEKSDDFSSYGGKTTRWNFRLRLGTQLPDKLITAINHQHVHTFACTMCCRMNKEESVRNFLQKFCSFPTNGMTDLADLPRLF